MGFDTGHQTPPSWKYCIKQGFWKRPGHIQTGLGNDSKQGFFGDKIDNDKGFFDKLGQDKNSFMPTPVKLVKGEPEALRQYDRAFNGLYSKAVPTLPASP